MYSTYICKIVIIGLLRVTGWFNLFGYIRVYEKKKSIKRSYKITDYLGLNGEEADKIWYVY